MVEHSAVNRVVVGSSPTRGAHLNYVLIWVNAYDKITKSLKHRRCDIQPVWLRGQAVKTSPFHGGNTGSIPVGVTYLRVILISRCGSIGRAADL